MMPFKNFSDLRKHFNNELVCVLFLEDQRWNGTPICPHCGSEHHSRTKTRLKHEDLKDYKDFRCKACDKKYSVLTGTMYESSKIPLQVWFQAVYLISGHKKGISSVQLASDMGVTQKTAWFMLHRIRNCFAQEETHLGGSGNIVEGDETIVGGKTHNKNKAHRAKVKEGKIDPMSNKSIVMGMMERKGSLLLRVLKSRNKIIPAVVNNVNMDASLVTDSSGVYKGINKLFPKHEIVDHSNDEFARGKVHTNSIEGVFSHFDRMVVGVYHYISKKHLQQYCDEFTFRWNRRSMTDIEKFVTTVTKCEGKRLKYKELVFKPSF
jgi:transposase-like protein